MARELTPSARNRRLDEFRKEVLAEKRPVSAEARANWWAAFQESVTEVFGKRKVDFRKPGHPAEMFKARVHLQPVDQERWEVIFAALETEWRDVFGASARELHTSCGFDGPRMFFEFVLLDGEHYLTGSVTVDRWIDPDPEPVD